MNLNNSNVIVALKIQLSRPKDLNNEKYKNITISNII